MDGLSKSKQSPCGLSPASMLTGEEPFIAGRRCGVFFFGDRVYEQNQKGEPKKTLRHSTKAVLCPLLHAPIIYVSSTCQYESIAGEVACVDAPRIETRSRSPSSLGLGLGWQAWQRLIDSRRRESRRLSCSVLSFIATWNQRETPRQNGSRASHRFSCRQVCLAAKLLSVEPIS